MNCILCIIFIVSFVLFLLVTGRRMNKPVLDKLVELVDTNNRSDIITLIKSEHAQNKNGKLLMKTVVDRCREKNNNSLAESLLDLESWIMTYEFTKLMEAQGGQVSNFGYMGEFPSFGNAKH